MNVNEDTFWQAGTVTVILPVALITIFVVFLNYCDKHARESPLRVVDKKHTWQPIISANQSSHCSACETLLLTTTGFYCDSCGVCADSACLKKVASTFNCKEVSIDSTGPMKHRWIKGNLLDDSLCYVCSEDCVEDVRCIWCHRTMHLKCLDFLGEVCDVGKLRQVIVPPTHVNVAKKRSRMINRVSHLRSISDPGIANWTPLFVIANPSSGSHTGEKVLSGFRLLLNPLQVTELEGGRSMERLSYVLSLLPETSNPIVLVAGGDGSVASVIAALYEKRYKIKCGFKVGIVPLGTGNDLARVLGWGKEEPQPFSASNLLEKLLSASPVQLDRWELSLGRSRHLGLPCRPHINYMFNYMSVGVDARVTLDFHQARNSSLYLGGRLMNKALYLLFGTQQVVEKKCTGLEKQIELELDGLTVDLPELEAVVLLNIPSWGAGCQLWELKEADEEICEQSMSDGKLEVAGIYSSFHMAQLQVGLSTPYRIGQASTVRIILKSKAPMQVDGEPWVQSPGVIEVKCTGQVTLLKATSEDSGGSDHT